jgi:hypothetical protein
MLLKFNQFISLKNTIGESPEIQRKNQNGK